MQAENAVAENEPAPAAEAVSVPVAESAAAVAGEETRALAHLVEDVGNSLVRLVTPGWGSSGYYSREVLRRDGPRVFKAGLHMFEDHATEAERRERPENKWGRIAGVLTSDASWQENGLEGPGLYANARFFSSHLEKVRERKDYTGLSIDAIGWAYPGEAEGRRGSIIDELVEGKSVDLVTRPGRGGKVVALFESARVVGDASEPEAEPVEVVQAPLEVKVVEAAAESKTEQEIVEEAPPLAAPVKESEMSNVNDNPTRHEFLALQESFASLSEKLDEQGSVIKTLREENAALREKKLYQDAYFEARDVLSKVRGLPARTQQRLAERLAQDPPTAQDGSLDKATFKPLIEGAARDFLSELSEATGGGAVQGLGRTDEKRSMEQVTESIAAKLQELGLSATESKKAAAGRL